MTSPSDTSHLLIPASKRKKNFYSSNLNVNSPYSLPYISWHVIYENLVLNITVKGSASRSCSDRPGESSPEKDCCQ